MNWLSTFAVRACSLLSSHRLIVGLVTAALLVALRLLTGALPDRELVVGIGLFAAWLGSDAMRRHDTSAAESGRLATYIAGLVGLVIVAAVRSVFGVELDVTVLGGVGTALGGYLIAQGWRSHPNALAPATPVPSGDAPPPSA